MKFKNGGKLWGRGFASKKQTTKRGDMVGTSRLELFLNDINISSHIKTATTFKSTTDWFVHATLENEEPTSGILTEFNNRSVSVRFRFVLTYGERGEETSYPWHFGRAASAWRLNEERDGELILYGTGRLGRDKPQGTKSDDDTHHTISATVITAESIGGVITNERSEEGEITLLRGPSAESERAVRNAEIEFKRTEEVRLVTSHAFVLFLASSAASSYRLLYNSGISMGDGSLLHSSLVLLPLAVEYFIKYLLIQEFGPLPKEHKTHMLLKLFDALPFPIQKMVNYDFKDELIKTGRPRDSHNIRVCLMRFRNAFTTMRYLFDLENANTSMHLREPDHIIVLMCALNALERVCGGPLNFRGALQEVDQHPGTPGGPNENY